MSVFAFSFCAVVIMPNLLAMSDEETRGRQAMVANFVKDNQKTIRNGKGDKWMSNFLKTQNLTFHRSLSSPSAMSDSSSQNLVVLADVGTAACASGWTRYDLTGMCYQQSKKTMNWYQGEDYCWNLRPGAHSASVHSQEEAKWLNSLYRDKKNGGQMDSWIGLRRDCDNVTYIWTDGSPTDCLWWQPDYPKSEFAEFSCVTIWETDWLYDNPAYIPGQYDDMKECSDDGSNVICKYDPNTLNIGAKYEWKKCGLVPETTKPTTTTPTTTTTTTIPSTTSSTTSTSTTTSVVTTTTVTSTTEPTTSTSTPTTTTTMQTTTPSTTSTPTTTSTTTTTSASTTTISTTKPPTTQIDIEKCTSNCPVGWIYFGGLCYSKIQGPGRFVDFNSECTRLGGKLGEVSGADGNEALRLALTSNNGNKILDEAWIQHIGSYNNVASGYVGTAGSCYTMILSKNNGGSFAKSGTWRPYDCTTTVKEF
ncbi:C-type lectin domain-containing protein [Caenorhabditis elegans]|uniref:C-type lectin domain-containing protein n=1 Tax=Caenorhabditis elegans TaxID=6239 RepID=O45275_CAEEL|nr:C-type lectin domain-containing protein [Caenorhabditis elegans]CAB02809.2 C-type lectin domain-containing protein [Caenorhabditis elegans]|eukprot:NP_503095.2 C-type LECtin [Caenorhabditis elegans]